MSKTASGYVGLSLDFTPSAQCDKYSTVLSATNLSPASEPLLVVLSLNLKMKQSLQIASLACMYVPTVHVQHNYRHVLHCVADLLKKVFVWNQENVDAQLPLAPGAHACFTLYVRGASDFLPLSQSELPFSPRGKAARMFSDEVTESTSVDGDEAVVS